MRRTHRKKLFHKTHPTNPEVDYFRLPCVHSPVSLTFDPHAFPFPSICRSNTAEAGPVGTMETANTSRKITPAVPPPPLPPHVHATSAAAALVVLLPTSVNFAIAMASGVSGWLFVHPADVVKVSVGVACFFLPLSCMSA
jgi:hypothetical protein